MCCDGCEDLVLGQIEGPVSPLATCLAVTGSLVDQTLEVWCASHSTGLLTHSSLRSALLVCQCCWQHLSWDPVWMHSLACLHGMNDCLQLTGDAHIKLAESKELVCCYNGDANDAMDADPCWVWSVGSGELLWMKLFTLQELSQPQCRCSCTGCKEP